MLCSKYLSQFSMLCYIYNFSQPGYDNVLSEIKLLTYETKCNQSICIKVSHRLVYNHGLLQYFSICKTISWNLLGLVRSLHIWGDLIVPEHVMQRGHRKQIHGFHAQGKQIDDFEIVEIQSVASDCHVGYKVKEFFLNLSFQILFYIFSFFSINVLYFV